MEPSKKSPGITALLDGITDRTLSIRRNVCVSAPIGCGQPIGPFKNDLSRREYTISGLCQRCQDSIFG